MAEKVKHPHLREAQDLGFFDGYAENPSQGLGAYPTTEEQAAYNIGFDEGKTAWATRGPDLFTAWGIWLIRLSRDTGVLFQTSQFAEEVLEYVNSAYRTSSRATVVTGSKFQIVKEELCALSSDRYANTPTIDILLEIGVSEAQEDVDLENLITKFLKKKATFADLRAAVGY